MTAESLRQSVVFAARFEYQAQRFEFAKDHSIWIGDPFASLPKGVEPVMTTARRREYWKAVLPPTWTAAQVDAYQEKHWCGGFTLYCLKMAGLAQSVFWKDGIGYCEPSKLTHVRVPQPGDIAYFAKNSHYAIVEEVRGDVFDSIDGNQGATLARPSIKVYRGRPLSSVAAFYSIQPFLLQPTVDTQDRQVVLATGSLG